MAQKKLLCILVLLAWVANSYMALAVDNIKTAGITNTNNKELVSKDEEWAKNLNEDAMNMLWQNLIGMAGQSKIYAEDYAEGLTANGVSLANKKATGLMIFVSNSMPIPLLQSYAKEAEKYSGVLVFKGLPEGGFQALSKLVMQLQKEGDNAAMQIDDEGFERFGIKVVPSIVLASEESCLPWQTCNLVYDKIIGNIGVRAALVKFSEDGELKKQAQDILRENSK